jgi:hypothetical protein
MRKILMIKTTRAILWVTVLTWVAVFSAMVRGGDEKTFKGEIADTQCALNVHSLSQSHKEMIQMRPEIKTHADCARFCVRERGGRFTLQTKDKVYKLDNQNLAEKNAGLNVKVIGTLDPKTGIITVHSIEQLTAGTAKPASPK